MSFLKRLFGGGGSAEESALKVAGEQDYQGYRLIATPQKDGAQYRICGRVERTGDGGQTRSHQLIRADLFPSSEEAAAAFFRKAQRLIDEQGDRIFQD